MGSPLLGRNGRRFTAADALADARCSDTPTRQLVTSTATPVYCQGTRVAMSTEWWDGSTAREVTLTARPAKRTHGFGILEPTRHTVPQGTPTTPVHRVHVRQLDARPRVIHPSRYPSTLNRATRFAETEARTTRFVEKTTRLRENRQQRVPSAVQLSLLYQAPVVASLLRAGAGGRRRPRLCLRPARHRRPPSPAEEVGTQSMRSEPRRGWGGRLHDFSQPLRREPRRSWPQRRALPGRSTDCPTRRKLTGP